MDDLESPTLRFDLSPVGGLKPHVLVKEVIDHPLLKNAITLQGRN